MLEECGLPYRMVPVNIGKGEQFTPQFLAISPNNRMPAIVDQAPDDGGAPISVFESGAILIYLAEKTGRFIPTEPRARVQAPVGRRGGELDHRWWSVLLRRHRRGAWRRTLGLRWPHRFARR